MAPDVKQRLKPLGVERLHELLRERERGLVMTGGVPGEPVLGQAEALRAPNGAAVEYAAGAQRVFGLGGVRPAGIGYAHDRVLGDFLQDSAILHQLVDHGGGGHLVQPAVVQMCIRDRSCTTPR